MTQPQHTDDALNAPSSGSTAPAGHHTTTPPRPEITPGDDLAEGASIVDTILDLDAFLSGDVRRATKRVPFSTRPDLEARIDELELQLSRLVDDRGRPIQVNDGALSGPEPEVAAVMADYRTARRQYDESIRVIELEALGDTAFDDFRAEHPALNDDGRTPAKTLAFDRLIIACAKHPTFTEDRLAAFRNRVGAPVMNLLADAAWYVNTQAGVSAPKSPLFSAAQRQQERSAN